MGLTPPPCLRRVKRLEQAGIITGYRATVDPVATGQSFEVIVSVEITVTALGTGDVTIVGGASTNGNTFQERSSVVKYLASHQIHNSATVTLMGGDIRVVSQPGVVSVMSDIA